MIDRHLDPPRVSLCQLSLLDTSFEEDVGIAVEAGASGLGVIESKIGDSEVDYVSKLENAGLAATVCAPEVLAILPSPRNDWWFPGPPHVDARIEQIAEGIRHLGSLGSDSVFCLTGPAGDYDESYARSIVVDALRSLAAVARSSNTRIAIEPMRLELRSDWTLVSDLQECLSLLDEVGEENVGIVFDVWHMWDSADVDEMIPRSIDRIFGVQVSDYRDPNRGPRDRVIAGDGVARVAVLIDQLRDAGYQGWYDLELFSDDGRFGYDYEDSLWKLSPLEFAQRQVDGFLQCYYGDVDV